MGTEASKSKSLKASVLDLDDSQISELVIEALKENKIEPMIYKGLSLEQAKIKSKENDSAVLFIIPKGFGTNIKDINNPQKIETRFLLNNFSLFGATHVASIRAALAGANEKISNLILTKKIPEEEIANSKKPISTNDFVLVDSKEANISPEIILGAVSKQITFIPIILFMVIIIASQMIATAIATEKENKTLETLLSSPVGRQSIVYAKLIGAAVVSLFFVLVYMFGLRYYMAGMTQGQTNVPSSPLITQAVRDLGLAFSNFDYILLGVSIFLGIATALAFSLILGVFAESVKAVQGVIAPIMLLVALPYFMVMFLDLKTISPLMKYILYAIPFSHPFLVSNNLLLGKTALVRWELLYQLVFLIAFAYIISKIFASDKILTMKLKLRRR